MIKYDPKLMYLTSNVNVNNYSLWVQLSVNMYEGKGGLTSTLTYPFGLQVNKLKFWSALSMRETKALASLRILRWLVARKGEKYQISWPTQTSKFCADNSKY